MKDGNKHIHTPLSKVISDMQGWGSVRSKTRSVYDGYLAQLELLETPEQIATFLSTMLEQDVFPNITIINQLIKKLRRHNDIDNLLALHNIAVDKGIANSSTYNSTIYAISHSTPTYPELAEKLLNDANKLKYDMSFTYDNAILAIAKSDAPDVDSALKLLNQAERLGCADTRTHNITIAAIANSEDPDVKRAIQLLDDALRFGIADSCTYNTTINVIAKSHQPNTKLALELFEEAKGSPVTYRTDKQRAVKHVGLADECTYDTIISLLVGRENPNVTLIGILLYESIRVDLLSESFLNKALRIAAKSNKPSAELAIKLVNIAEHMGWASVNIYNIALDIMANSRQAYKYEHSAFRFLDQSAHIRQGANHGFGHYISLNDLSYAEAYFALKRFLKSELRYSSQLNLNIHCGQNLSHSIPQRLHSAISRVIKEFGANYHVVGQKNTIYPGQFDLAVSAHTLQHHQNESSTLRYKGLFSHAKRERDIYPTPYEPNHNQNVRKARY